MKILILNGHPKEGSFCDAIAESYRDAASKFKENEVKVIRASDAIDGKFTISPENVLTQQELISWADHFVLVTPVWWLSYPAPLKLYIDSVFTSGFAYSFKMPLQKKWNFWQKHTPLLKGKSAFVAYTQDASVAFTTQMWGDAFWKQVRDAWLSYCGFRPVQRKVFSGIYKSTIEQREEWLKEIGELATDFTKVD